MKRFGVKEVLCDDWRLTVGVIAVAAASLIAGFSLGWAWNDRSGGLASVSILEVLSAFGTISAAGVAAWLGVREVLIRREERSSRAAFAQGALWPEFRRYLAAIERLQQDPSRRRESVSTFTARLEVEQWVRDSIRDLRGQDFHEAVAILANLQHARRHLDDLLALGDEYPRGNAAKVSSIKIALSKARRRIVPLVRKWRVQ